MTLLEHKTLITIVIKYYNEIIKSNKKYFITPEEYAEILDSAIHGSYQRLMSVSKSIRLKKITDCFLKKNTEAKHQLQKLVRNALYLKTTEKLKDNEQGLVIEFNPILADYFNNLKSYYSKKQLHGLVKLSSSYTTHLINIFFSCLNEKLNLKKKIKPLDNIFPKNEIEIDLTFIRENMGINNKYKRNQDLKNRVINKSIQQIKLHKNLLNFELMKIPNNDSSTVVLAIK